MLPREGNAPRAHWLVTGLYVIKLKIELQGLRYVTSDDLSRVDLSCSQNTTLFYYY